MKKIVAILFFALTVPLYLMAQNTGGEVTELQTDRPTRAQGASVVPRPTVQIETGFEYQKDETGMLKQKELLYPEMLIRIGILKNAELRINAAYKQKREKYLPEVTRATSIISGFSEVQVGAKVIVFKGGGALPQIGVLGNLTLPAGTKEFRPPHIAPEGRLLINSQLTDKIELNYNVGYRKRQEADTYQNQALYAVTGTLELTDKLKYFVEVFGQKPKADKAEHQLDTGFMFKIISNLQVDLIGGTHINETTPDAFVGGGLTWRLPR